MFTQYLVKDAMFEAMEIAHAKLASRDPRSVSHISETSSQFERVLHGLIEGDAQLGLPECSSDEAARQLEVVHEAWHQLRALLKPSAEVGGLSDKVLCSICTVRWS